MLTLLKELISRFKLYIIVVLLIVGASFVAAWQMFKPAYPVHEVFAPAEVLPGGELKLEKRPDATAKPKTPLKRGEVLERKITVTLQASNPVSKLSGSVTIEQKVLEAVKSLPPDELKEVQAIVAQAVDEVAACPPVTVELALIRNEDQTRRVVASSPDGIILGGIDVPVLDAAPITEPRNWGIGPSFDPFKKTAGLIIQRRIHSLLPLTVGGEIHQTKAGSLDNLGARVHALYNF